MNHTTARQAVGLAVWGLVLGLAVATLGPQPAHAAKRPWPNTSRGVHVFNDQLASGMSQAQIRFAARNYDGTQKMLRADADRLRSVNKKFLILHYRLGIGLGLRTVTDGCRPDGEAIRVVEGDRWVREWPDSVNPGWFYTVDGERVLNCDWGWYLANLDNSNWRSYWQGEVLRQLRANDDDGVFMDSLSVPNYLGASSFRPQLAAVDRDFEHRWANSIDRWLGWLQKNPIGRRYYLVPNAGSWITTRDQTTYASADGVMIEGFALEADASPYAPEDWRLQMNRALKLISRKKAVIAQTYVTARRERTFTAGSYLLIKGSRTFLNIDNGLDPEWWPEYDVPIGRPRQSAHTDIDNLRDSNTGIYRRRFTNGEVLVNPTNPYDESGRTATVKLSHRRWLARTRGGGTVSVSGRRPGRISYKRMRSVRLAPYSAAILLKSKRYGS